MKWAIVRDGVVENVILYDGEASYLPPTGTMLVQDPDGKAEPGGTWDGTQFQPAGGGA